MDSGLRDTLSSASGVGASNTAPSFQSQRFILLDQSCISLVSGVFRAHLDTCINSVYPWWATALNARAPQRPIVPTASYPGAVEELARHAHGARQYRSERTSLEVRSDFGALQGREERCSDHLSSPKRSERVVKLRYTQGCNSFLSRERKLNMTALKIRASLREGKQTYGQDHGSRSRVL